MAEPGAAWSLSAAGRDSDCTETPGHTAVQPSGDSGSSPPGAIRHMHAEKIRDNRRDTVQVQKYIFHTHMWRCLNSWEAICCFWKYFIWYIIFTVSRSPFISNDRTLIIKTQFYSLIFSLYNFVKTVLQLQNISLPLKLKSFLSVSFNLATGETDEQGHWGHDAICWKLEENLWERPRWADGV